MYWVPSRRLTGLDALRGIAALMVFGHHVQLPGLHPATLGLDAGVLIFFSLSGYVVVEGPAIALGHRLVQAGRRRLPVPVIEATSPGWSPESPVAS